MALTATAGLLGSQLIVGIVALYHPNYTPEPWHQFLIYLAYTFIMATINAFANSLLPMINSIAVSWSLAGFAIISITVLACASPDYNSADFVFTNFTNTTGWPNGELPYTGILNRVADRYRHRLVAWALAGRSFSHRLRCDGPYGRGDPERGHGSAENYDLLCKWRDQSA